MNTVTITGPGIDGNAIQVNPYFKDDHVRSVVDAYREAAGQKFDEWKWQEFAASGTVERLASSLGVPVDPIYPGTRPKPAAPAKSIDDDTLYVSTRFEIGPYVANEVPGNYWHRDPPNQTGSDHLDVYWRKAGLSSVLWRPVDKAGQSWTNVATADDLARAEAIARGIAENGR